MISMSEEAIKLLIKIIGAAVVLVGCILIFDSRRIVKKSFSFGDENSKNTILYIHGGAYINEINYQHLLYCR